ncbi:SusC/RagA family TonB-linked outer membrane protein [Chitinophaga arvensicola]|uniref:TonB-linked outer membrane protein, SusC/RagA family n=1 Tax=Chitinophaga arvensicola TaxID=29529 RepID=A0A1I0SB66_9BACT|nr:TonB-dependent receptor [Chitinophaga arvensicola]SEW53894.1 TonB-linked outer membrane protein, SusC/RagA family [Chitinophaga arvensicola]
MTNRLHLSTRVGYLLGILLLCTGAALFAQEKTGSVKGIVRNEQNEKMPFVSVVARNALTNLSSGAQTDSNGIFIFSRLPVNGTYTFVISSVGYEPQTLPGYSLKAGESTSVLVKMKSTTSALNEIVVVGYGTQRKTDLTGSIATISQKDLAQGVNNNALQAINGKAAGVYVNQSSSAPGGGVSIRVRGAGSINSSNDVLVVVDGLPGVSPSSISQDDIESIQVLKDASAAAIYGSRAANGVVLITTKKGSAGKMNITYDGYVGLQQVAKKLDVLSAPEYMKVLNELSVAQNQPEVFTKAQMAAIGNGTDWQDQIFKTAMAHNHQLSMSGGTKNNKYYVGLNYFNQDGILKNTNYEKYNARINYEIAPSDKFNLQLSVNLNRTKNSQPYNQTGLNENAGAINTAVNFDPTVSASLDANGRYQFNPLIALENPLAIVNGITQSKTASNNYGTVMANYTPIKDLTFTARLGVDLSNSRADYYNSRITQLGLSAGGIGSITNEESSHWIMEYLAKYDRKFGEHQFSLLLGTTTERYDLRNAVASSRNFLSDITNTNLLGSGDGISGDNVSSSRSSNKLNSYLGRLNYNYKDKYLLTASFRADGTSRFSDQHKYAIFPSLAAGWNIHRETFMQAAKSISNLKLRIGYGQIGNQAIENFATLQTYIAGGKAVFGDNLYQGAEPARLPNENLKWETTEEYNIGIDLGLFNDRITASVEYYKKNSGDQLFSKPVAAFTGFSSQVVNFGNVQNSGVDILLNTRNIVHKNFTWETGITASVLRNKVTSLPDFIPQVLNGAFSFVPNFALVQTGLPIYSYYGYEVTGIFKDDAQAAASGQAGAKAGDPIFKDTDGNKVIDAKDRTVLGSPLPKFTWGFTNTVVYKRFSLNALLLGVHGISTLDANVIESLYPINFQRNHMAKYYLDRWTKDNTDAKYPSGINSSRYGGQYSVNSMTVQDVSFVRLKTLTLSYQIPVNNAAIRGLTVYGAADNLLTFSSYDGYDPDANALGGSVTKVSQNSYPLSKVYRLGLKVNF